MPVRYQVGLDVTDPEGAGSFSGKTVLVNTVNTAEGTMGAGVALAFKERFPDIMMPYKALTEGGHMYGGDLRVLKDDGDLQILAMATKQGWKNPSKNIWVGAGLLRLAHHLHAMPRNGEGVRVLLPRPGCGNGGLDFADVNRMIRSLLGHSRADIIVSVSSPEEAFLLRPHEWRPIYAGIGTRKSTPEQDAVMRGIATICGARGLVLRSGHATGSDAAFEAGYRDWQKHPKFVENGSGAAIYLHTNKSGPDLIPYKPWPAMLGIAERFHDTPLALGLSADVIEGRKQPGDEAALMARNGHQVFGDDFSQITDAVVCCTPGGRSEGGTGQALRMARLVGIPVIDIGHPDHAKTKPADIVSSLLGMMKARETEIRSEPVLIEPPRRKAAPITQGPADDGDPGPDLIDRADDVLGDEDGNIPVLDEDPHEEINFGPAPAQAVLSESDRRKRATRESIRSLFESGDVAGAVRSAIAEGARTYGAVSLVGGIPATAAFTEVSRMLLEGELVPAEMGGFTSRNGDDPSPS